MAKKYGTKRYGPEFFREVQEVLARDAESEGAAQEIDRQRAASRNKVSAAAESVGTTALEVCANTDSRTKPGRKTIARNADLGLRPENISQFFEVFDTFGFHNFRTAVPSPKLIEEFNAFLKANALLIRLSLLTFAGIPQSWLEDRSFHIPDKFDGPKAYADAMIKAVMGYGYRLVLDGNFFIWNDIFDALKQVQTYREASSG